MALRAPITTSTSPSSTRSHSLSRCDGVRDECSTASRSLNSDVKMRTTWCVSEISGTR